MSTASEETLVAEVPGPAITPAAAPVTAVASTPGRAAAPARPPPSQVTELRTPDVERYRVKSRFEIVSILREIAGKRTSVTLSANAGADFILTCVLAVNPDFEEVVLDVGSDRNANRRLTASNRVFFITYLEKIRIQFVSTGVQETNFEGTPALRLRLPESIVRLQRREFYRVQPLMSRPAIFRIPDAQKPGKFFDTRVIDIGAGGAGVLATERLPIDIGVALEGCAIDLPDAGRIQCTADAGYVLENIGPKGKGVRFGMRFRAIDARAASTIQRYIMKVDRERRGRS